MPPGIFTLMHALFLCTIALTAAFVAGVATPGAIANQHASPPTEARHATLEPETADAHARALGYFPGYLRARLGNIPIERAEQYAIPDDAPLAWRLMGAAAHAAYSNSTQSVSIFDAGVRGASRWTTDLTAPEHHEPVAEFLDALAEPLRERAGDTPALWRAFSGRVRGWSLTDEPDNQPPFPDDPHLGCPRVFDAFVRLGVPRALGGTPPLEHLIIHELAHAMQIRDGGHFAMGHMQAWGSLAGWKRVGTGEPFDGFAQGGFRMENPETLIALLLADDPAEVARAGALYEHHPDARFVNHYARFDPREDFAECVRLFATDPDRLIEISPERFAFINAMGWCAELDAASPGPLWHDREAIEARGWNDAVHTAAAALLDPQPGQPETDLLARAAIVRAHAALLDPTRLPPPQPAPIMPLDLPGDLLEAIELATYTPMIDGIAYPPDEHRFMALLLDMLLRWQTIEAFERELFLFYLAGAEQPQIIEAIKAIERSDSTGERVESLLALLDEEHHWNKAPEQLRDAAHRAIVHSTNAQRPLLGEQIRLTLAMRDPALPEPVRRAAFDRAMENAHQAEPTGDAMNLHAMLAEAAWRLDPTQDPARLAERIPGQTLGLIRRTLFLIKRIEECRDPDHADQMQELINTAQAAIDASPHTELRDPLHSALRDALPSPHKDQP